MITITVIGNIMIIATVVGRRLFVSISSRCRSNRRRCTRSGVGGMNR